MLGVFGAVFKGEVVGTQCRYNSQLPSRPAPRCNQGEWPEITRTL